MPTSISYKDTKVKRLSPPCLCVSVVFFFLLTEHQEEVILRISANAGDGSFSTEIKVKASPENK